MPHAVERALERLLFASRWALAPFYVGLALGLLWLLARFAVSSFQLVVHGLSGDADHVIVGILGLIDLSLVANLIVIVMFSGYENFIGRLHLDEHPDRPGWMGHVAFGDLKLKLVASVVAIAAVHVLEDFMDVSELTDRDLAWRSGLLMLFAVVGVLLAVMDRVMSPGAGSGGTKH